VILRFEQDRFGMSRKDVLRIVGVPPGDYSNGRCDTLGHGRQWPDHWLCEDGELFVRFDDAGAAYEVVIYNVLPRPTLPERPRRWLGLCLAPPPSPSLAPAYSGSTTSRSGSPCRRGPPNSRVPAAAARPVSLVDPPTGHVHWNRMVFAP